MMSAGVVPLPNSPFVIVGKGGLFGVIREIRREGCFLGYFDDASCDDKDHLGPLADCRVPPGVSAFVAIGAIRNMRLRARLLTALDAESALSDLAISDRAHVSTSAVVGAASILCPFACVHSNARVGIGAVLFSSSVVEHDCVLGDNVNIGPGATLAGRVEVGNDVFIGAGSVIKDGVKIGTGCVVGAGSLVLDNVPEDSLAFGSPARVIRRNDLYQRAG